MNCFHTVSEIRDKVVILSTARVNIFNCQGHHHFLFHPKFTYITISYVSSHLFPHLRDHYEFANDQLPDRSIHWFERCSSIAEVMGSNPVQAINISLLFPFFYQQLKHIS